MQGPNSSLSNSIRYTAIPQLRSTSGPRRSANITIAWQIAAGDWQSIVQRLGECEVVAVDRGIEDHIASVDGQIRARSSICSLTR
jgi:hypothetical protein